jgi:putative peptide zinc metalloprotease protein
VWPLFEARDGEEATFIVGSRERNRFLAVPQRKLAVVEQVLAALDGTGTAAEIERRLATSGTGVDVAGLCRLLEENGLLEGTEASKVRRQHVERFSLPLFHLPTERAFTALAGLGLGWVSWLAWASAPIILAGIVLALRDGVLGTIAGRHVHAASGATGAGLSVALMLLSFAGHEVAHGVVALRHGMTPRRFEACLYLGIVPLFFLRIPGLYTLPRAERLKVWSAGIVWNLLAASSCILAIEVGVVPMSARPVVLVVALANYSMALFNLVPFLPTDGYFLLSTALRRHNVREHAWRELARWASGREHRLSGLLLLHVAGVSASLAWVLHRNLVALRQGTWGSPGPWLSLALFLVSLVLILGPFVRHLRRAPETLKPAVHPPRSGT